jgi:hypothetical protein
MSIFILESEGGVLSKKNFREPEETEKMVTRYK